MSDVNFKIALEQNGFIDDGSGTVEAIRKVVYDYVDLIHGIRSVRERESGKGVREDGRD